MSEEYSVEYSEGYQAGWNAAIKATPPAQPAPVATKIAAQLRAMACNYPAGHLWDKLDAKACIEGALLLEGRHPKDPPAAQPAPVQEPVAWMEHEWSGSGLRHLHFERREQSVRDEVMNPIWTPLYTTPPAQPALKPLTPELVNSMAERHALDGDDRHWYVVGIVDSEAAHGIKENT